MPKKSAAALAVVQVIDAKRPRRLAPPLDLLPSQVELWRTTVGAMPADFFGQEQVPILRSYVLHLDRAAAIERALHDLDPLDGDFQKLAAASVSQSKAALAFARALRLTNQSRIEKSTAGRKVAANASSTARKPWEITQ